MEPKPIVELQTFLGILLMNSYYNTDIFFSNYYNLQSVHFELYYCNNVKFNLVTSSMLHPLIRLIQQDDGKLTWRWHEQHNTQIKLLYGQSRTEFTLFWALLSSPIVIAHPLSVAKSPY